MVNCGPLYRRAANDDANAETRTPRDTKQAKHMMLPSGLKFWTDSFVYLYLQVKTGAANHLLSYKGNRLVDVELRM